MKNQRFKLLVVGVVASLLAFTGALQAQTVDSVVAKSAKNTAKLKVDQKKMNSISDSTYKVTEQYRRVLKQIEGQKIFNAQQQLLLDDQKKSLNNLESSIARASTMERDLAPMIEDMIDTLSQIAETDLPFRKEERQARVAKLKENLGNSNLSFAEKYRQVLEAYRIELGYGSAIESYTETVEVNGVAEDVNILRVGRLAYAYQTKDQQTSAIFNKESRSWETLDSKWNGHIDNGIKIATKKTPLNIITIPVPAPQEAN